MKIAIAADALGLPLKEEVVKHLTEQGYEVKDYGTLDLSKKVPYTECAQLVAKAIQNKEAERGLLFCGTGMGMSIMANKHKGVYCACVESAWATKKCRIVNNANVLAMGASIVGPTMAKDMVDTFLKTAFAENDTPEHTKVLEDFLTTISSAENEIFKD